MVICPNFPNTVKYTILTTSWQNNCYTSKSIIDLIFIVRHIVHYNVIFEVCYTKIKSKSRYSSNVSELLGHY